MVLFGAGKSKLNFIKTADPKTPDTACESRGDVREKRYDFIDAAKERNGFWSVPHQWHEVEKCKPMKLHFFQIEVNAEVTALNEFLVKVERKSYIKTVRVFRVSKTAGKVRDFDMERSSRFQNAVELFHDIKRPIKMLQKMRCLNKINTASVKWIRKSVEIMNDIRFDNLLPVNIYISLFFISGAPEVEFF